MIASMGADTIAIKVTFTSVVKVVSIGPTIGAKKVSSICLTTSVVKVVSTYAIKLASRGTVKVASRDKIKVASTGAVKVTYIYV
jgi:hypothetical protein